MELETVRFQSTKLDNNGLPLTGADVFLVAYLIREVRVLYITDTYTLGQNSGLGVGYE